MCLEDPSDGAIDENDGARYLLIDQKIRDMLRSKQLSKDVNVGYGSCLQLNIMLFSLS